MSPPACPACGEESLSPWRTAREVVAGQPAKAGWVLRRCGACGSAALEHPGRAPSRSELYETGAYAASRDGRNRLLAPLRKLMDRERLSLLGPLPPRSRVIEVGAGRGRLVAALRTRGHDAVGIEPSRASSGEAMAHGLPIEPVALEEAEFPAEEADLVVLWHVLEHLDRPDEALLRVREWLKRGSRLVLAVPNLGSVQAKIGGDRWFHQDVPRHRTHFTVSGLTALLRRTGYVPGVVRHLMIEQNWLGMWLTLLNLLTVDRDVPFRFARRDLSYESRAAAVRDGFASVLIGTPLAPAAAALELGAGLARRGGTVVVDAAA